MSTGDIIGIIALAVTLILYFADKIINGSTRAAKKYMLQKWLENKEKSYKLQQTIFYFANTHNGWNSIALTDSPITYKDFYDALKERYEIEYSEIAYKALKKERLSKFQIEEFTAKLKVQEENLYSSQIGLDVIIKKIEQGN